MSSAFHPADDGSPREPGRTSSFMSSINHRTSAPFAAKRGAAPAPSAKRTILVVEDDDNSLFVLKDILKTKGYLVLEAWDGQQAVEVAEAEKLDLILLDLQLPRLSGMGVIRRLRENETLAGLPIVLMTGCDPEKYRGNAIAAGCNDFLLKPIDFDRLEAVLECFVPLH
jgi:DNA-binding response OmpR family regulator